MKHSIYFVLSLLFAFTYFGCKNSDTDITSPGTNNISTVDRSRPFNGNATGIARDDSGPGCISPWTHQEVTGTGTATHIGLYHAVTHDCYLTTSTSGGLTNNGTGTLTAANGDEINVTYSGSYTFNAWPPTSANFVLNVTIIGGTGRFQNATGSFTAYAVEDLTQYPKPFTLSWTGTISY